MSYKYRCKNLPKNTSKANLLTYKKVYTQWSTDAINYFNRIKYKNHITVNKHKKDISQNSTSLHDKNE